MTSAFYIDPPTIPEGMALAEYRHARQHRRKRSLSQILRWPLRMLALPLAALAIAPPVADATGTPFAVAEDCRDAVVLVPGVEERVRRRVPAQFELVRDPLGRPLLFVFASRCERYAAGGTTGPNTEGYFVAIIESPDGSGCLSRWPVVGAVKPDLVPLCHFYFLSGAFDNPAVVSAYRARFPGVALRYVPDLAFGVGDLDPTRLGAPLRFRAGRPTPSPFELDAVLREQPAAGPATFSFWHASSSGTVGARLEFDELALGQSDVGLRAAPGSEMAELLGSETPTPIAGFVGRYPRTEVSLLPGESVGGSSRTAQPRIRLTVRPVRARRGQRERFRFRATASDEAGGGPVPAARVRLGRRTARTDSRGRARSATA